MTGRVPISRELVACGAVAALACSWPLEPAGAAGWPERTRATHSRLSGAGLPDGHRRFREIESGSPELRRFLAQRHLSPADIVVEPPLALFGTGEAPPRLGPSRFAAIDPWSRSRAMRQARRECTSAVLASPRPDLARGGRTGNNDTEMVGTEFREIALLSVLFVSLLPVLLLEPWTGFGGLSPEWAGPPRGCEISHALAGRARSC